MLKRAILLFLAASALSACSDGQGAPPQPQPSRIDGVEARISEAVKSADRATAESLAVWEPVVPILPEGVALPSEALIPIAVNWNGPIDDLLEAIADLAGYEFAVVGSPPAGQGTVAITARNEPLFGVAVRAGYLVPGRAGVALDPAAGKLELHWAG